jgi:hypothetical protein
MEPNPREIRKNSGVSRTEETGVKRSTQLSAVAGTCRREFQPDSSLYSREADVVRRA